MNRRPVRAVLPVRRRAAAGAVLVGALAALAIAGCDFGARGRSREIADHERAAAGRPASPVDGATRFLFDDFGGLGTDTLEASAVPWKLAATALVLHSHPGEAPTQARLQARLQRFGLFVPATVGNWPGATQPAFRMPMGLVAGPVARRLPAIELEVATIGCASCHAGPLYDAAGRPTRDAWLGLPNTSLDLDAYADAVLAALRAHRDRRDELLAAIPVLFPETSERELKTLRRFVWPRLATRLDALAGADALPFRNGGPGRSNGIDALKLRLGLPVRAAGDAATVSIPALADRGLRSSLLVDGLYVPKGEPRFRRHARADGADIAPGAGAEAGVRDAATQARIVGFFTVSTMGVAHAEAPDAMPRVAEALRFLDAAAPAPPFPGPVDAALAARGATLYAARCASCHGDYDDVDGRPRLRSFPNVPSPLAAIGSDPHRASAVDAALLARIRGSTLDRHLDAAATGGYVAPILTGVWATAPYLHNGSVPTLAHLLAPDTRPARFQVGGHALDLQRVGIAGVADGGSWRYPDGYVAWSDPAWFDTALPGRDRRGHEAEFRDLRDDERAALIEFLKRL